MKTITCKLHRRKLKNIPSLSESRIIASQPPPPHTGNIYRKQNKHANRCDTDIHKHAEDRPVTVQTALVLLHVISGVSS